MKKKLFSNFEPLSNFELWAELSIKEIIDYFSNESNSYENLLKLVDVKPYGVLDKSKIFYIATFLHEATKIKFNLIPGGRLKIGLSEKEKEMMSSIFEGSDYYVNFSKFRKEEIVYVNPFLISQSPVTQLWFKERFEFNNRLHRPVFDDREQFNAIYLSSKEINTIIDKFPYLRLPTEREWEYACRSGKEEELFYFGDEINIPYVKKALGNYNFSTKNSPSYANRFGLFGLGTGEWCSDNWDPEDPYSKVIKSGGSIFYPWASKVEILMAASSFRQPSSALEDGTCGVRFILNT